MSRLDDLTSWHADWRGLSVAVLGLGVTGFAAADTLAELGADVLVVAGPVPASGTPADRARLIGVIGVRLVQADLFADPDADPAGHPDLVRHRPELLIVSPGFHPDHPLLLWAARNGIPVWGDI